MRRFHRGLIALLTVLGFSVPAYTANTATHKNPKKVRKLLPLVDGSHIVNDGKDFVFIDLQTFGAPAFAMKDKKTKELHYFMTETHFATNREPAGFCTGKMITKSVCALHPFTNSLVLAKLSSSPMLGNTEFVHTILVAKTAYGNEQTQLRLAHFLESIK